MAAIAAVWAREMRGNAAAVIRSASLYGPDAAEAMAECCVADRLVSPDEAQAILSDLRARGLL